MIVGVDQGTYSVIAGTRQFTVSGLNFDPSKEGVLMILNITQDKIYYAAAQSYTKALTITETGSSNSFVFEYSTIFPVLGVSDVLHIQLQDETALATADNQTSIIANQGKLRDESGTLYGVKHINNKPRVSSMPYLYDIAEGNVIGHETWTKIGYNDNIGTSQETMWSYSTEYSFITTAGQVEVLSSDNTKDITGGTGALTVRVGYLKSDYSESSVTLTLNGTTPVPSGASHADIWRINSFRVMTTGTDLVPAGNITLRQVTGAKVVSYIRLGKTRARNSVYTVPLGKTLYVTSLAFSAVGTKYLIFTTHVNYDPATNTILQRGLFMPFTEVALLNTAYVKDLGVPTKIPATVDLKVSVVAEAAGSLATCHLRGWLE